MEMRRSGKTLRLEELAYQDQLGGKSKPVRKDATAVFGRIRSLVRIAPSHVIGIGMGIGVSELTIQADF